ncbi:helix-turn-helix domain-containing protein [Clostridium sp. WILCCON 0269]|uniref:Helix-turn-helix domain-containing protein n=1 Tax=Candidatus Clostridium eludens TaxID=3381663 RepID=A0ABW8SEQ9_9CLOT
MGLNELIKIGDRIKIYRKKLNITQAEMAEKLGIPRSTYANYESNTREPNNTILQKIATVLGVSEFDLLYDPDRIKAKLEMMDEYAEYVQNKELEANKEYERLYYKINNLLSEFDYDSPEYEIQTEDNGDGISVTITDKDMEDVVTIGQNIYIEFGEKMLDDIKKYREMRVLYFLKELKDEE